MSKNRLLTLLFALVALVIPSAASASGNPALAHESHQWSFGTSALQANVNYGLTNLVNGSRIGWDDRTFGPDLGWKSGHWQMMIYRGSTNVRDHRVGPIAPGDKVTILNTDKNRYLVYNQNTTGINLGWSTTPSYEWKLEQTSTGVSLLNTVENDYVVYGERSFGINLMWLKDLLAQDAQNAPGALHDASVSMAEQPIYAGPIPYLGYYGGGAGFNGVLTKVTNPYNNVRMNFVLPGHSSQECENAGAVTTLAPNATMTAAQMQMLWGSAQPNLSTRRPFLACVAGTLNSSVFVNIQWRSTGSTALVAGAGAGAMTTQSSQAAADAKKGGSTRPALASGR